MESAYVYVIAGDSGPVKVGHSINPTKRLAGLQTSHPERLSIRYSAECIDAPAVERRVHQVLRKHRLNGEWFSVTVEVAVQAVHDAKRHLEDMTGLVPEPANDNPAPVVEFKKALNHGRMTQRMFAQIIGVNEATVANWISGKAEIPKLAWSCLRLATITNEAQRRKLLAKAQK